MGMAFSSKPGKPDPSLNYWGILLQDYTKTTFDGDLHVPGLELKAIPIRAGQLGWVTSAPRVMNTVSMQMRVLHTIAAGSITKIVIGAPQYVRFMEDQSAVSVSPK